MLPHSVLFTAVYFTSMFRQNCTQYTPPYAYIKYTTNNSNKDVINFIANVDNGIYRIKVMAEEEKQRLRQRVVS